MIKKKIQSKKALNDDFVSFFCDLTKSKLAKMVVFWVASEMLKYRQSPVMSWTHAFDSEKVGRYMFDIIE